MRETEEIKPEETGTYIPRETITERDRRDKDRHGDRDREGTQTE